jgi:cytochrome b
MAGALIIVAVLLLLPVIMAIGGAVIAATLSWSLNSTVAAEHEGSELLELNR